MKKRNGIRAESFDRMQYFYGSVHEPLIHAMLRFSGRLDEAALKRAVTLSADAIPLIRCRFHEGTFPRWEDRHDSGEEIVHIVHAGPGDCNTAEWLLTSSIDIAREPQLKIFLLRGPESDTLCLIINHMVCDGAGFKEYLYLLSDLYAGCAAPGREIPALKPGDRGAGQLFAGFGFRKTLKIACAKANLSKHKTQALFHLQGDPANPFILTRLIGREDFQKIRRTAKSLNATVNDMVLAAYARVLSRKTGERGIIIPCPVDLRKYLRPGREHGICNLTSNYLCGIEAEINDSFADTLKKVSAQMKRQKESTECLKPVLLLETVFHLLPFPLLRKIFSRLFTIPVLSYTNLGILEKDRLCFGELCVTDAFLTGAVKYVPYFQIAVSTFDGRMTLSCNLHGTLRDREEISEFLIEMHREMIEDSFC